MKAGISRRRFLTISAAFAAAPAIAGGRPSVATWHGVALGAQASIALAGASQEEAHPIFAAVDAELARLEEIFSLYKPHSALSHLNRTGRLFAPPSEMLALLSLVGVIHSSTNGAFDPTVQPLWSLHAQAKGQRPDRSALSAALRLVGWANLGVSAAEIAFAQPGMAMTLNGIAQGYITDSIAALLRRRGFTDILIDIGEVMALGHRPDGGAWQAGIAAPGGRVLGRTALSDRALATSASMGTRLGGNCAKGHILDPRTGFPAAARELVSVSADRAVLADGLSTAFSIMSDAEIDAALKTHTSARLELAEPLVRVV